MHCAILVNPELVNNLENQKRRTAAETPISVKKVSTKFVKVSEK